MIITSKKHDFYYRENDNDPVWIATAHNHSEVVCETFEIQLWMVVASDESSVLQYLGSRLGEGWTIASAIPLALYLTMMVELEEQEKIALQ